MLAKAKKLIPLAFPSATALAIPANVFAATDIVPSTLKANQDIIPIIRAIIQFILVVAFVLAFVMLLIGGIRWITAGGDEKGVASARNMITAALIGLVVILVAFALIKLVETFFGVQIISGGVTIPTVQNTN